MSDHVDTFVLDVCRLRILFVVDEILGQRFGHQLLGFILLNGSQRTRLGLSRAEAAAYHVGGHETAEVVSTKRRS